MKNDVLKRALAAANIVIASASVANVAAAKEIKSKEQIEISENKAESLDVELNPQHNGGCGNSGCNNVACR